MKNSIYNEGQQMERLACDARAIVSDSYDAAYADAGAVVHTLACDARAIVSDSYDAAYADAGSAY